MPPFQTSHAWSLEDRNKRAPADGDDRPTLQPQTVHVLIREIRTSTAFIDTSVARDNARDFHHGVRVDLRQSDPVRSRHLFLDSQPEPMAHADYCRSSQTPVRLSTIPAILVGDRCSSNASRPTGIKRAATTLLTPTDVPLTGKAAR